MCDQTMSEYLPLRPGKLKPVHPSISYCARESVSPVSARKKGKGGNSAGTHQVADLLVAVVPVDLGRVELLGVVGARLVVEDGVCSGEKQCEKRS